MADFLGIAGLSAMGSASSLLSSRWSRDNLITSDPARLYCGKVRSRIGMDELQSLIEDLEKRRGSFRAESVHMGVFTWDVSCTASDGPFVLQIPLTLDEEGRRGRRRCEVPRLNVLNIKHFYERGLSRFLIAPREHLLLGADVPAATFNTESGYFPLLFSQGALRVDLCEAEDSWTIPLGLERTADLLSEMVATLVYHYEPETEGGTAITDIFLNDGDFLVRRTKGGSFQLRLSAARRRESGISPSLLLLYLIQMMAYEDWQIGEKLIGVPVLVSNPAVAFEGLRRGLRYRFLDLGRPESAGDELALKWIEDFGRSREGSSYRPWADKFVQGSLPLSFGEDLREHWWRLTPLQEKLGLETLRSRHLRESESYRPEGSLRPFLDRLSQEIGRSSETESGLPWLNSMSRSDILSLFSNAPAGTPSVGPIADEILDHWPYRDFEHLTAKVPALRKFPRLKNQISFGKVLCSEDEGTLKSLSVPLKNRDSVRPIANPEIFDGIEIPSALQEKAAEFFPSFEAYMDAALQDEKWGYYAKNVQIAREGGHFSTHPETLSPHYGGWIASWAFKAWRDLVAQGELLETDSFNIVEFGAGNGRLARDFLDHLTKRSLEKERSDHRTWQLFAAKASYRIYEKSSSLRRVQKALLAEGALVLEGDARRAGECLERDFPRGMKGFIVSNELPDAFGVHKLLMTKDGVGRATLVIPRIEKELMRKLDLALIDRISRTDQAIRSTFNWRDYPADLYLNQETFAEVMDSLSDMDAVEQEKLGLFLRFREAFVDVRHYPELAQHLRDNSPDYATALAAEDSGVVQYINVHAGEFIRGLGRSLEAGIIVTIDYGDSTWELFRGARRGDFPFRVYGEWEDYIPRPNDPYFLPGTQDLTADVNFSSLARAGEDVGLSVLHFGFERDITDDSLPEILSSNAPQQLQTFLGSPVFKVLFQGRGVEKLFEGSPIESLPLFRPEMGLSKPKGRKAAAILNVMDPGAAVFPPKKTT